MTNIISIKNTMLKHKEMTATEVQMLDSYVGKIQAQLHTEFLDRLNFHIYDEFMMSGFGEVPMRQERAELQFDDAMQRGWKLDMLNQCYRKP